MKPTNAINDVLDDEDTSTVVGSIAPDTVVYTRGHGLDESTLVEGLLGSKTGVTGGVKALVNSSLQQLQYNQNKFVLDRSIMSTIDLLDELSEENHTRPIFFPVDSEENLLLNSARAHLALLKQLGTKKLEKHRAEEESPKLSVLKLELKLGPTGGEVALTLDKKTIANLVEKKIRQQIKYLENLKDRVDDTSSKVFVTGDLNAGKLTFCNALLRRKVLPEDQQPCTLVFCEVVDANRENHGVEEVHAVAIGADYNRDDETTFEKHCLSELEDLVQECDKYAMLKVYVIDHRGLEKLLLANGVIDIKLIDAPGLNMDLYQTTQVFSRQEEIDLVVFVVLAENHFTLSAKEFIAAAANERRYVFIVVNRFDNIRDQEKCKRRILDQIKDLSPETYKNAEEFVHFVSLSGAFPEGDDGDDGDENDNNDNPDFDLLEASLRKFILDKRALSKLLPAKDYLTNLLKDLAVVCEQNEQIWSQERRDKTAELEGKIVPACNLAKKASDTVHRIIMKAIDLVCLDTYDNTRNFINQTVSELGHHQLVVYGGLSFAYDYALSTQKAMLAKVMATVNETEELARETTTEAVDEVVAAGQRELGDEFLEGKRFNPLLMFSGKQTLVQPVNIQVEVTDFFDPSIEGFLVFVGLPPDLVVRAHSHIGGVSPTAILTNLTATVESAKAATPQSLALQVAMSGAKWVGTGAAIKKVMDVSLMVLRKTLMYIAVPVVCVGAGVATWYIISDLPHAYPRNYAKKLQRKLKDGDFAHQQATRVSKETREVLNYPAFQVQSQFQTSIDKKLLVKKQLTEEVKNAGLSVDYFHGLDRKVKMEQATVGAIELV